MRSKQKILKTVFFALSLLFICNVSVWSQKAVSAGTPGDPTTAQQVELLKQEIARYEEKIAAGDANNHLSAEQVAELKTQIAAFEEKIRILKSGTNPSELKQQPAAHSSSLNKESENILIQHKQAQLAFEKAVAENKTNTAEFAELKAQLENLSLKAEAIQNSQDVSGQKHSEVTMENYKVPSQNTPDITSELYKQKARASAHSELMVQAEMLEKQFIDFKAGKLSPEEGQRIKTELEKVKLQLTELNNSK